MADAVNVEFSSDEFESYISGRFAYVIIKGNAFKNISDIMRNQDFIPWFDLIEHTKELKGIVVLNEEGSMSDTAYSEFLSELSGEVIKAGETHYIEKFKSHKIRALEINMLSNLIRRINLFTKLFIVAFKDEIVSPFIGVSLAADFRLISSETKFCFSHSKYGLPASGALPYFLPKYVSNSIAFELVSKGGYLDAEEIKALGLVNRVFPTEEFKIGMEKFANELSLLPTNLIRNSKLLFYRNTAELEDYLNFERQYLI